MTDLNNAVVLITGAGGGFGYELTRQILAKNGRLILTDLTTVGLEKMVAKVKTAVSTGDVLACIEADLSTDAGINHLFDAVNELKTPVDVLINNAGVAVHGRFDEVPEEQTALLMQINLLAPMTLCGKFMPQMIARKKGHIVNISSVAGWIGPRGLASYAASKFGLRGFSEAIADELAPYNVQVTAVYPYFSRTPIINTEHFGTSSRDVSLPESELTDPADVMAEVVKGIERNTQHVFPDKRAKQLHIIKRFIPTLLKKLTSRN